MYHARLLPRLHVVSGLQKFSTSLQLRVAPRSPYHVLLNLDEGPNQFIVDLAELRRNFIQAQRLAHPDKVATQGAVRWNSFVVRSVMPFSIYVSTVNMTPRTLL